MLTLTAMLVGSAKSNGSQLAIVEGERSLTYAELVDRSTQVAGDLSRRGFRPGDRLVNWLPNSEEWLVFSSRGCPLKFAWQPQRQLLKERRSPAAASSTARSIESDP